MELPTLLSCATERRLAQRPEEFGHGAIEGWPDPKRPTTRPPRGDARPLLTLGLPTSATAAVLLAAFQQFRLQPGPLLFEREPVLVWSVIASSTSATSHAAGVELPLVRLWAKLLDVPKPQLHAGIVTATLGAYSVHRSAGDLVLLIAIGVLGFALRRMPVPIAPVMIG
jgi:putative tricarboxylic transport membrane protein